MPGAIIEREERAMRSHLMVQPTPPAHTAESELVSRAARGDEVAFEVLMRRHNQALFRTARSILRSDAEAEEAVQDALFKAWRALPTFRGESKLTTWLMRIVTNEALGRARRVRARTIPLEDAMTSPDPNMQLALADTAASGPESLAFRSEVRNLIEKQVDALPEAFRTVFMLNAVEGLTPTDIAEVLDIPVSTVRTRAYRARQLLRAGLVGQVESDLSSAFSFDGVRCDRIVASVLARCRASER